MAEIVKGYQHVFRSNSAQLAVTSFAISLALTAVIFILLAATTVELEGDKFSLKLGGLSLDVALMLSSFFVFVFVVVWFLLYLQYNREAEDVYSRLRDRLGGPWIVTYEMKNGQNAEPLTPDPIVQCSVAINDAKKLEFTFVINEHPVYRDDKDNPQPIKDISMRHDIDKKYSLTYYFKGFRLLQPEVTQHIDYEDDDEDKGKGFHVQIFASLKFEALPGKTPISKMSGEWFDLNGNVTRLTALLDEIRLAGKQDFTFKKKLSDVFIDHHNFSAAMGTITFTRPAGWQPTP